MVSKNIINSEIRETITALEKQHDVTLSTIQKILLSMDGPIATILDVLYGNVNIFMLDQNFKKSDKATAELLDIDEGDEVDYRELIIHKHGRPLVYALTYIPTSRCSERVINDLHNEKLTTGKIMYKYDIETLRIVHQISIEKTTPILKELFKTDEDNLTREYVMIHHGKIVMWTKEVFPLSFF